MGVCASSQSSAQEEVVLHGAPATKYVVPPDASAPGGECDERGSVAASALATVSSKKEDTPRPQATAAATPSAEHMLLKVSALMQRFAEARSERATPVQVLRRVLDMVVVDCGANFARRVLLMAHKRACMRAHAHAHCCP